MIKLNEFENEFVLIKLNIKDINILYFFVNYYFLF